MITNKKDATKDLRTLIFNANMTQEELSRASKVSLRTTKEALTTGNVSFKSWKKLFKAVGYRYLSVGYWEQQKKKE